MPVSHVSGSINPLIFTCTAQVVIDPADTQEIADIGALYADASASLQEVADGIISKAVRPAGSVDVHADITSNYSLTGVSVRTEDTPE